MNAAALRNEAVPGVRVESEVLGPLTVSADHVLDFPDGVLGFPDARRFVLVAAARDGLYWLQSTEHASLVFLVLDPFLHFPDYAVEIPASNVAGLSAASHADIAIFTIVTLSAGADVPCTANLQGPLAINLSGGIGRQLVLRNGDLGVRRAVQLEPAG